MATTNMCNQFDFVCNGRVVYKGAQFTEYEEVEQPKPEEPEKEPFSAKSLFGKALGGLVAVACVAAVVGLAAAYVASVVVTGGASLAAAPLLVTGTAFLLTSGFAAYSGASALNAQYQSDLANKKDSGWGAYLGAPALEAVKTGAKDLALQMAIPVVGKAAGPVISKYAGKLMAKIHKPKVTPAPESVPRTGPKGLDPNHHNANVMVKDINGKVISHERIVSGTMTAKEKALGFPKNTLASHTEARAVTHTPLSRGQSMTITGQRPPCPSCKGYMNRKMKETGADIRYQWRQDGKTHRWP